ncbi:DUF4185 domain-containing protein [Actinomadura flavalba]|uniref:DUF4185 domain-containing protein n=1 Tax=Actinomadura flavalba TaxID=1120938 RepID=UPI00036981BC|nr:DUF4185 domain-containing protein [Actinomadura flavalba]
MPRRRLLSALLAAPLTLTLAAPVALADPPPAPPVCAGKQLPAVRGAAPNAELDRLFTRYGNDNRRTNDWTGADGTYSTALPGGKVAFVFSDTFLGKVDADGGRSKVIEEGGTTPFLNNTFVVKSGDRLTTVTGGTPEKPRAAMPPRDDEHWYWAGDAITSDGHVQATYQEYERFGPGIWDWRWSRNVLARFRPDRLGKPVSVTPLPSGEGVAWASWLERSGPYIYVYGVEDGGAVKSMHLARVKGGDLRGRWEYAAANGRWSRSERDAAPIMPGVANEYSVTRHGTGYLLLTQDTTEAFSDRIVAYYACAPRGPFTAKTPVYRTPETGASGTYGNPNVFTYNAHAHPELSRRGSLVVSYNVNSLVNTDHYRDVSIYRPRFITVRTG